MEDPDGLVSRPFLQVVCTEGFERTGGTLASVWLDINRTLDPVLGRRGMAALYDRSVQIAQLEHAWVAGIHERLPSETELDSLARVFDARDPGEAARGGAALLRSFCRLLASLVGASLTERLLRPVLINLSNGKAVPDESS
jgi:hypothetical protein